jgi:dCTP deaminase
MSVLTRDAIWEEMKKPQDPLVVTPLLEKSQIGDASIDVRLGHEFIVLRRSSVPHVDPTQSDRWTTALYRSQERIRIATLHEFVLHPGDLVLGATLEYLSLPTSLTASVEGRSSWGRLGLIIATASTVAPGFKGCITLELVNNGVVPLAVHPGMRIAQLVLNRAEGDITYGGKYGCPTGPQFSRLNKDNEIRLWGAQPHQD